MYKYLRYWQVSNNREWISNIYSQGSDEYNCSREKSKTRPKIMCRTERENINFVEIMS